MLTPPAALMALLFAAGEPVEKKEITEMLSILPADLEKALGVVTKALTGGGLTVIDTGTEVELRTAPEAAELIKKLRESEFARDLGKAGLETLAVIAYRAGSTRSEIDWVRGVNSSASVRTLLVRGLIEGEEDPHDRRKIRYRITTDALGHLGVAKINELPRFDELAAGAELVASTAEAPVAEIQA